MSSGTLNPTIPNTVLLIFFIKYYRTSCHISWLTWHTPWDTEWRISHKLLIFIQLCLEPPLPSSLYLKPAVYISFSMSLFHVLLGRPVPLWPGTVRSTPPNYYNFLLLRVTSYNYFQCLFNSIFFKSPVSPNNSPTTVFLHLVCDLPPASPALRISQIYLAIGAMFASS